MKLWLLVALHFGCYGIIILMSRIGMFSWLQVDPLTSTPMIAKLVDGFSSLVLFLVPVMIFANAALPEGFEYYKLHRKVNPGAMIVAAIAMLTSVFFIDVIYNWNIGLYTDPAFIAEFKVRKEYSDWAQQMPGVGDLLIYLLASAFVPAVLEEVFFRGGVQQLILEWTKKPHLTIIVSAFIFSFLHFDVFGFIARFILGIGLGYLFWWSGSLRLSIIAHLVFNALGILSEYFNQHWPQSWWARLEATYVLGAISLVVSVGAMLTVRNLLRKGTSRFS